MTDDATVELLQAIDTNLTALRSEVRAGLGAVRNEMGPMRVGLDTCATRSCR
jgi:hypothetical protein